MRDYFVRLVNCLQMKFIETSLRINIVSLKNKKITGTVVALLSCIYITGAQASRDTEKGTLKATTTTEYSVGNEYKPKSPFSVDREKKPTVSNEIAQKLSETKQLVLRKEGLLSKELEAWVNQNGYSLLWNSNRDYIIYNTIILNADSFDNVLNELGKLFDSENYGLVIKQYEVNKVIIIDAQ